LLLALLSAVALASPEPSPAKDPLETALFEICPALLDGSIKADDASAISARGFRIVPTSAGRNIIIPANSSDVQIDTLSFSMSCEVDLPVGSPSVERLSRVLKAKGLSLTSLPSPIGGTLINSKDRTGKLITTTQVSKDFVITLVVGKP